MIDVPDVRVASMAEACSHLFALKRRWIAWSEGTDSVEVSPLLSSLSLSLLRGWLLSFPLRRYWSIRRPIGVVRSGKRRLWTWWPKDCRLDISRAHCVDLPALSSPSNTMNFPLRLCEGDDI